MYLFTIADLFGEEMDNEVANPPIEGLPVLLPDGKTSNHAFVFRAPTFEIRGDELPAALASRVGQFIQGECDTRAREADARARAMELRSWKSVLSEFRRFLALPFLGVAIFAVFQSRSGQEMVAALIRD